MTLLNSVLQNDTVKVLVLENQKSLIEYIKEPNTLIAIVAILISVLGFIYSVRYSRKTLKQSEEYNNKNLEHNIKSIEPILGIPYHISYNEGFIKINMVNGGLGTAIVKKFSIVYQCEVFTDFSKLLYKTDNHNDFDSDVYFFPASPYFVPISPNNNICILSIMFINKEKMPELHRLLRETKYNIEYETIYGEKRFYDAKVM